MIHNIWYGLTLPMFNTTPEQFYSALFFVGIVMMIGVIFITWRLDK